VETAFFYLGPIYASFEDCALLYHFDQKRAIPRRGKVSCFNSLLRARGTAVHVHHPPAPYGEHVPRVLSCMSRSECSQSIHRKDQSFAQWTMIFSQASMVVPTGSNQCTNLSFATLICPKSVHHACRHLFLSPYKPKFAVSDCALLYHAPNPCTTRVGIFSFP